MAGLDSSRGGNDMEGLEGFETVTLDCQQLQCPEPILRLAKAARNAEGPTVFEVLATDAAFPLDLKSWCRSAGASIRSLDDNDGVFRAIVTTGQATGLAPSSRLRRRSKGPFVALPDTYDDHAAVDLDCLGLRCPEPIMQVARRARDADPATVFRVRADDDAFPVDIEAWCRSARATLEGLERAEDGSYTAVVVTESRAEPSQLTSTDPVKPARATSPNHSASMSGTSVSFSLTGMSWDAVEDRLQAVARLGGARVELEGDDALTPEVLRWCDQSGTNVIALEARAGGAFHASLHIPEQRRQVSVRRMTAAPPRGLARRDARDRCALLVLNNDHEALLAAMLVANGAAAQGMEVVIFFSFWGLNLLRGDTPRADEPKPKLRWSQRLFKWLMPVGPRRQRLSHLNFGGAGRGLLNRIMKDKNILTLPQLMASVEASGARYIACTMSMEVMGISRRDLVDRPNLEFGGVTAFVEQAQDARITMVF